MTDASWVVLFVVGVVVSLGSSWLLVSRLERLGERAGLSEALLGMVAALAADAPEIPLRSRHWRMVRRASGRG